MLRVARRHSNHTFIQGAAERLPFVGEPFDLVSAGLAFHWFDRIAFLREARRILRPNGLLLTYNDGFCGVMRDNADFTEWNRLHLKRFPSPPRQSEALSTEIVRGSGFREIATDRFSHDEAFTLEGFSAYLCTQTNTTAAIAERRESQESVSKWLADSLPPYSQMMSAPLSSHARLRCTKRSILDEHGSVTEG